MNKKTKEPIPFIEFQITSKCNYRCEYCIQKCFERDLDHASDKVIDAFINLVNILEGKWKIKVIGGEALTHPRFFEVVEAIASAGQDFYLVTNFSFPIEYYKRIVDLMGDHLIALCPSLHLSQVKSVDEFINKADIFNKYKSPNTNFPILSVLSEENFEQIKEIHKKLTEKGIRIRLQHLKVEDKYVKYSDEINEFLEQNPKNFIKRIEVIKEKKSFGTVCSAGYKLFRINNWGNVHRCFSKQKYLDNLGSIVNGSFTPLSKPMPCCADECRCIVPFDNNMIHFDRKNYALAHCLCLYGDTKNFLNKKKLKHFYPLLIK